jgi:hypothetical protein
MGPIAPSKRPVSSFVTGHINRTPIWIQIQKPVAVVAFTKPVAVALFLFVHITIYVRLPHYTVQIRPTQPHRWDSEKS